MKQQRRRNLIALFIFICASTFIAQAEELSFPITFEQDINYTWVDFGGATTSIVSNPDATGINGSTTVSKIIKSGGEDWAGSFLLLKEKVDFTTHKELKVKVYTPAVGTKVTLKLEDADNSAIHKEISLASSKANAWEELIFNFSDADIHVAYKKLVLFFDLGTVGNGTASSTYYIDDISHPDVEYGGEDSEGEDSEGGDSEGGDDTDTFNLKDYTLVWADEFNTNGSLDDSKWFHQTQLPSGGSWYNGEVQHYTNRSENSYLENGVMKLVAKKEPFTDQGVTKNYTSARLNSKFAFTYGRVEVKAKLPSGVGTWPAIWMLGKNISEAGAYWQTQGYGNTPWPACGEIDIMEHWGHNENVVSSAMHTPSSYGGTVNTGHQTISNATSEFHVYAMDWDAEKMVFTVDGQEHYRYAPAVKNNDTWPYDKDQYLLFNIAIQSSISPSFTESAMEIDYVRVYQKSATQVDIVASQNLNVYPNPTTDMIHLTADAEIEIVEVFSLGGTLLRAQAVHRQNTSVDLSALLSGVYMVRIRLDNGVKTVRVVKR